MTKQADVQDFLAQRTLALVGVSREAQSFSRAVYGDLKAKGYRVYPVNPNAEAIGGEPCYPSLAALPEKVGAALFFTPPAATEAALREAAAAGVTRLWLQQGADSPGALQAGAELGVTVISGECIMMFAEPAALHHRLHRWFWGLAGRLPR